MVKNEDIYELYWVGPFDAKAIKKVKEPYHKLYAVYSPHPIYGKNALTYIGMSKRGASIRIEDHKKKWFDPKNIGGEVYFASIHGFDKWENSPEWGDHSSGLTDKENELIQKIEALLIFALQPAYNSKNKQSASSSKGIRLFNTGAIGDIPQEISALFHIGY